MEKLLSYFPFKPVCSDPKPVSDLRISFLIWVGKLLQSHIEKESNPLENSSNLSIRRGKNFLITGTGQCLGGLSEDSFSEVTLVNEERVSYRGMVWPSSETRLHAEIYRLCPNIHAIIHVHDNLVKDNASQLGLFVTKEFHKEGSLELAREAGEAIREHGCIALKDHGLVVTGKNSEEAWENYLSLHLRALEIRCHSR